MSAAVHHKSFFLKDLNSHLVCSLCEGYFREAITGIYVCTCINVLMEKETS